MNLLCRQWLLLLCFCCQLPTFGQISLFPSGGPESLIVCDTAGTYTLLISNGSSNPIVGATLSIDLPTGMYYEAGSSEGALEQNINDLGHPSFSIPFVGVNNVLFVHFKVRIDCQFNNSQGIFYLLQHGIQQYSAEELPLPNYYYPQVGIVSVENQILTLAPGQAGTRSFRLIQSNSGASLDSLYFVSQYGLGLQLLSINIGQLVGSGLTGDTLLITGSDWPGADGQFDFGDTLMIEELIQLDDCNEHPSSVEIFWQCGGQVCQSIQMPALTTFAQGTPSVVITNETGYTSLAQVTNAEQVGGGFCEPLVLTYKVSNQGTELDLDAGAALDLSLAFGLNRNLFAGLLPENIALFPNWSFSVEIAGQSFPFSAYQISMPNPMLGYNILFNNINWDIDGPGGLEDVDGDGFYDDLPVGASFDINIIVTYDPDATPDCAYLSGMPTSGGTQTSFRIGYQYSRLCGNTEAFWYNASDAGLNILELFLHRNVEFNLSLSNTNLVDGDTTTLTIRPLGEWRSPCEATDSFLLQLVLPEGLVVGPGFSSGPGTHYGIVAVSGDTVWLAGTEHGNLDDPWVLPLQLDCSRPQGDSIVELSFIYYCDPANCPTYKQTDCRMVKLDFQALCENCNNGIVTRSFKANRQTMGWRDVFQLVRADPAIHANINTKAALTYDSVLMTISGVYLGSGPFDSLYARVEYQPIEVLFIDPDSPHFLPLSAQLDYYPSGGGTISCPVISIDTFFRPSLETHYIDINLEPLFEPGACLETISRQDGDSLVLRLITLVSENAPIQAADVPELYGSFYSKIEGQDSLCSRYFDAFTLEKVEASAYVSYSIQTHYGCESILFNSNSVTNKGHLYDGDQFPDEVRTVADVSQIRIYLEGSWAILPGTSTLIAAGSFNANGGISTVAPGVNFPLTDPLVSTDGTRTIFTYNNQGYWPKGDLAIGGSNAMHGIQFQAKPTCNMFSGENYRVALEADIRAFTHAPGFIQYDFTSTDESNNRAYERQESALLLAGPQVYSPTGETIKWQFRLDNTTDYASTNKATENNWFAVEAGNGVMGVELLDITNPGAPISYAPFYYDQGNKFWFKVGQLPAFSSRQFELVATYTSCERDSILLLHGWSCLGYPNSTPDVGYDHPLGFYQCSYDSLLLIYQPTPLSLSAELTSPTNPLRLCEPHTYAFDLANTQVANAYDLLIDMKLPLGVIFLAGSGRVEIPAGSGNIVYLNDPIPLGGGQYSWAITGHNAFPFFKGISQTPENTCRILFEVTTDCNIFSGRRITFDLSASNSCGQIWKRKMLSSRLNIEGVPFGGNNYYIDMHLDEEGLENCGMNRAQMTFINLGPNNISEYEYAGLILPFTYNYVPASVGGSVHPPGTLADNIEFGNERVLIFQLQEGLLPGDSVVFHFDIADSYLADPPCDTVGLEYSALLQTRVACNNAPGDSCNIFSFLRLDTLFAPVLSDDFELEAINSTSVPSGTNGELVNLVFSFQNTGTASLRQDTFAYAIYHDINSNGLADDGIDAWLHTEITLLPDLIPGESYLDTLSFLATTDQVCQLLLLGYAPFHTCTCDTVSIVVPAPRLFNAGEPPRLCSGTTGSLGIDIRTENITYNWLPIGNAPAELILNPHAAITGIAYTNTSDEVVVYEYELLTERNGQCSSRDTVAVQVLPEIQASTQIESDYNGWDISCYGASDGALSVLVSVGTPPYVFDMGLGEQSINLFDGLATGHYSITITDADQCRQVVSDTLNQPPALDFSVTSLPASCWGGSDGSVNILSEGGTPAYTFYWTHEPGNTTGNVQDLSAGNYLFTITDQNDCMIEGDVFVGQAPPIAAQHNSVPATCSYSSDGQASVQLAGGTAPYALLWDNGLEGPYNDMLSSNWHYVSITDANNCFYLDSVFISAPPPLALTQVAAQPVSCYGDSDGTLAVSISGGTSPYQYAWSDGQTSELADQLAVGTYFVTVTDAHGCLFSPQGFDVTQPDSLWMAVLENLPATCYGFADGQALVAAQGGTPGFQYYWDNGESNAQAIQLPFGQHSVSVTDANGCQALQSIFIDQPTALLGSAVADTADCVRQLGALALVPELGTGVAPYLYSFNGGVAFFSDSLFSDLPIGTYQYAIMDANGCLFEGMADVPAPQTILTNLPESVEIRLGESTQVFVQVYNANGDYTLSWMPQDTSISCLDCADPVFSPLQTTTYQLQIEDAEQCKATVPLLVIVDKRLVLYIPNVFSPNGDGQNDFFVVYGGPGIAHIKRLLIADRWGNLLFDRKDFPDSSDAFGWNGVFRGKDLGTGVYTYLLEVLMIDGRVEQFKGDVILMR
ncbi:MAG TPA: gliding motility-associated C-terminal domain-containing protein [Saprospiraceae bacterium]|nr:gliding motility-associated C-terminal domain-containing protein [Saprospiraceae bacterium]HMQ84527.1 gliding motility-associated C-terminal domain-containing protein [Saprospiraceae bacterium]